MAPRLACLAAALAGALLLARAALAEPTVAVDQVGYPASWDQEALLISTQPARAEPTAQVIDVATGAPVATAALDVGRRDPATGDWLRVVRFAVRDPGRYRLVIGELRSAAFEISAAPYVPLERLLLRSFYLQRCGVALADPQTGIAHAACHLADAKLAHPAAGAAPRQPTTGGWHDAGDYGKYVATTAVAIARVLHAYERDPARFAFDDLGIPESGNGIPDVLDEMQVGLAWMLTMQRADGAVFRKVAGKQWPKRLVPERDDQARYVYGVTTPETAKAAAAWALSARLLEPYDPAAAARYLAAARRAWAWLAGQPTQVFEWQDGDDAGSGPYRSNDVDREASLRYDTDDRLWAVTELALTTSEPRWLAQAHWLALAAPINLFEWKDASLLALSYYLWHPALVGQRELARAIGRRVVRRAAAPLANAQRSGYRIANQRFVWGSNKMTAEEGILMCAAYQLTGRRAFLQAARDQLHYLLGRNHFGTSFVSEVGERSVQDVTHIFAQAAKVKLPGLFVGGPNDAEQAGIAPRHRGALSWIDDHRSYSSNEYAIDYNASLLGLLAELHRDCGRAARPAPGPRVSAPRASRR